MWRSTLLPMPKSCTAFHDCMGKLKSITFKAEVTKGTRLDAGTLRPVILSDNSLTNSRQLPDKNQIITPDKDIPQTFAMSGQEHISNACPNSYDISKQVGEYTSNPIRPIDDTYRVQNQTTEEWLDDHEEQWQKECDELF